MATSGFVTSLIILHPESQAQTSYRFLGSQPLAGQLMYVIGFAQKPEMSTPLGRFILSQGSVTSLYLQGIAWISADHRVLRLRTDLLHPIPKISLSRETSEIDYRPYHFLSSPTTFLLPNRVTVSVEWGRKRLRNEHTLSKFQLFNVDVHEEGAYGVLTLNAARQAFRVNPNNDNVHVNLGLALDNKGDLEAAIGEYREGLRLNPNNDLMSSTGDLFEAGNSNPLPTSFCERLGIYAHTSPSRPKISSLGEPIYCPGLQVRMLPAVCIPPGAGASLSYTRSTSAACNPFGPVFTSKLTLAPSSNDRYPLPTIAEKWTNTSSPLSRWMNP